MKFDLGGLWNSFLSSVGDFFSSAIASLLSFLPDSPFVYLDSNPSISTVLGNLNYFLPIDYVISVLQAWLIAVGVYYVYMVILRWAKAIE